jgi:4-amino-4-deoxy-L-arabinose transferase-like glycosyltransferase
MTARTKRELALVFLAAVLVRAILFTQVVQNPGVACQPDSKIYLSLAQGISQHNSLCYPDNPLRPDVERTPVYPYFLALIIGFLGGNLAWVLAIQALLDSLCCLLIYRLSENIWKGTGLLSGLLAAFNIGMISYAHFILNDSLFVFVFTLSLLALFGLLREGRWKWAFGLGITLAISSLVRPVAMYLPFFIAPLLFLFLVMKRRNSFSQAAGKVLVTILVFLVCISPWVYRNHLHYGRWQMSAQSGEHFLQYVVPFVWQSSKGIPFLEGMKKTGVAFREKASSAGLDVERATPFEISDFQVQMAVEYLKEEPKSAILKAWVVGAIKNLFSSTLIDVSYLLQIERPHFFTTGGNTALEQAWNFVLGMKGWFGWALIASLVVLGLSRIVQIGGLIRMMGSKRWEALCLLWVIGYFLLVSGPVGYAKYRLPFEPALITLSSIGLMGLFGRGRASANKFDIHEYRLTRGLKSL